MSGIIANTVIVAVSVLLPALIGTSVRRMFFKPRPPKDNKGVKKEPPSFNVADFTSKKKNPYAEE